VFAGHVVRNHQKGIVVVYVAAVPTPPLSALGFNQFSDFEKMNAMGITYLDTFFSREEGRGNESLHFHELVHVLQWQLLGPKAFIAAYAEAAQVFFCKMF
jgi:hypothetical protein